MDDPEDNETVFDLNGDEENDDIANPASSPHDTTQEKVGDDDIVPPKNKRKRTDVRRRIRKILSTEQLDAETVSAQKEEQERLRRLELQKSLNAPSVHGEQTRATPPLTADSPDVASVVASGSPVFVDVCSKKSSAVIVIDDSDEDCDIVETKFLGSSAIIEISDSGSDSELDDMDVEDEGEPENSGSHTNDDVNQPNVEGKVLVNVNHPPSEPDIFLSLYLSQCVKPHQIGGIRFLYDNLVESLSRYQVSPGFGCILAHSMGLGKTLQLICFIDVFLTFTKATKVLCIVPMNTIQNWCTEFNSWLPEQPPDDEAPADNGECSTEETDGQTGPTKFRKFKVFLLSDNVKTTVARSKLISNWEQNGGVLLMGYEMYRILAMYSPSLVNNSKLTNSKRKKPSSATTEVIDLDEEEKNMDLLLGIQKALCKPGPDLVVCDEGHRIKNNQANISQALKKIQTRRRVVLTGYPLQNNLLEYWCMVDFVRPNFLGTRHEFSNMFERPIINGQCVDSTASDIKLMRFRAHVLHSLLEGFVQRRSEAILTKSLPEKEEYVIPVKVSPLQMSLYKAFVTSVKNYVGFVNPIKAFSICIRIWNHPDILKSYLDKKDGARNDSPLTVVDPDLDIGDNLNKKTKEAKNDIPQRAMSQEAASTSSELKVSLPGSADWVGKLFDDYKFGVLQNGAKMVILTEIIEKTVSLGDRILVFSQSLSTLSMIEDFLRKRVVPPPPSQLMFQPVHWEKNKNYYRLDGGTSSQEREKLITAFNSKTNKSVFLFLLSTRACSLGVNLIGANRVVVFDASWNPCHDAQAVCRIYRYGQTKKCFIYRLVSSETFEKRMYERQVTKEGMSDRVIDELNPEANLTKQEVMNLFNETGSEVDGDEPDAPWSADKFSDPVLNHVCEMCRKSISEVPFKHKVQSTQKSKNTLTKAEKREAKKGYEREKRAIDSANKFVPVPGDSPLIREQMRREAVNRPIVHVKPIQNVQVGVSPFVRPPRASLPAVLPPLSDSYLGNIPSMAYLSRFTFPPLHSRYFPQGELTAFPPYPIKVPLPKASGGTTSRNPIVVNLLTSPEAEDTTPASDAGIEKPGQSTRVDEQSDTCIDTQATASSFVCSKGVSDSALLSHGGVNVLRSVDAAMPSESDTADHSIADTNEHSPHSSGSKGQKMDVGDPIEASTKAEPACTEEAASG